MAQNETIETVAHLPYSPVTRLKLGETEIQSAVRGAFHTSSHLPGSTLTLVSLLIGATVLVASVLLSARRPRGALRSKTVSLTRGNFGLGSRA